MVTMPRASASRYSEKDSARVRTMPRTPDWPYMIEMVSTKTLRAREPDHSDEDEAQRQQVEARAARRRPRSSGSRVSLMTSGGEELRGVAR